MNYTAYAQLLQAIVKLQTRGENNQAVSVVDLVKHQLLGVKPDDQAKAVCHCCCE